LSTAKILFSRKDQQKHPRECLTKIPGVAELLDPLGVELFAVRDCESVVVGNVLVMEPIRYFILVVFFDVPAKGSEPTVIAVKTGAASFLTPLVLVSISRVGRREPLQNEKFCEPDSQPKTPLEDGWIDPGTVEVGPVHLKASVAVLGEAVLI
jgi:hypothetical protein